jgi:hypothetical protein
VAEGSESRAARSEITLKIVQRAFLIDHSTVDSTPTPEFLSVGLPFGPGTPGITANPGGSNVSF